MAAERPNRAAGILLLAAIAMLVVAPAMGRVASARAATQPALIAGADSYVDSSHPNTNYGGSSQLRVSGSPTMRAYVRFDVPAVSGTLNSATLRMYAKNKSGSGFQVRGVSSSWGEQTISYANAPPPSATVTATSPSFSAGTWVTVKVTQLVAALGSGGGAVSMALTAPSSTATSFASRESGPNAPQLVLDTTPAAPPVNTSSPTISGTALEGETLSGSAGTWSGTTPISYAYQWQRCDPVVTGPCTNVGTNAQSYTLSSADVGMQIQLVVTASNSAGSASATSAPTAAVKSSVTTPSYLFDDEFNGPAGSQPGSPWQIFGGSSPPRWGLECFVNDTQHVYEDGNGNLVETATYNPDGVPCSNGSGPYESGGIDIPLSAWSYQYGTAEARIKVPCQSGTGMWPAWWEDGSSWPTGGEIGALEIMNDGQPAPGQRVEQVIHGPTSDGGHWQISSTYANPQGQDWCNDFHVYGSRWSFGQIQFTVDGVVTRTLTPGDLQAGWTWPFDAYPERLFLDLQVGSWGGTVDNSTLPQSMVIDWVRVSQ